MTGVIWVLTGLCVVIVLAAGWVMSNPDIVGQGQDPAGKGMAAGCFGIMLFAVVAVIGIVNAVLATRNSDQLGMATRMIGWLPVIGLVLAMLIGFIAAQVSRAREEDVQRQEELKIPVFLMVESEDRNLSFMYDTLRKHYPYTQMQLYTVANALHWQQHFIPRAKIICMQADRVIRGEDATRETDELIDDINFMNPGVHVLLHAANPGDAEGYLQKLKHASVISTAGEDWITTTWLPAAVTALEKFPELKTKPPDWPA